MYVKLSALYVGLLGRMLSPRQIAMDSNYPNRNCRGNPQNQRTSNGGHNIRPCKRYSSYNKDNFPVMRRVKHFHTVEIRHKITKELVDLEVGVASLSNIMI